MKNRDLINLLNRAAAALETPDDLIVQDAIHLEELCYAAKGLSEGDISLHPPYRLVTKEEYGELPMDAEYLTNDRWYLSDRRGKQAHARGIYRTKTNPPHHCELCKEGKPVVFNIGKDELALMACPECLLKAVTFKQDVQGLLLV